MGAYGFNDDKSKAPLVKMLQVTPNANETWGEYVVRLYSAINSLDIGHLVDIKINLSNTAGNYKSFSVTQYYASGAVYDMASLVSVDTSIYNTSTAFSSVCLDLPSSSDYVQTYVGKVTSISTSGQVTATNAYAKNDAVPNYVDCKIYYIP